MPEFPFYYENKSRFFMRTKQNLDDGCIIYEIKVPQALIAETPDTRNFLGLFNVRSLQFVGSSVRDQEFVNSEGSVVGVQDWVQLEPERLSMQLLRLAYMAALSEEGPYGSEDM